MLNQWFKLAQHESENFFLYGLRWYTQAADGDQGAQPT